MKTQALIIMFAAMLCAANAQDGWVWQNPQPPATSVTGVSFADADVGTIVGFSEYIARTTDGGKTWTPQRTDATEYLDFRRVCLQDRDNGFALGSDSYMELFRTVDGGQHWRRQDIDADWPARAIFFTEASNGYMICRHTRIDQAGVISDARVFRTTDGGEHWVMKADRIVNFGVSDVFFTSTEVGVLIGSVNKVTHWASRILRTVDGGATWFQQYESPDKVGLTSVCFPDNEHGVVVGGNGTILRTSDAGRSWSEQSSGTTELLWAVDFADRDHGNAVGEAGTILRTSDGGITWVKQASGTSAGLIDICFADPKVGYIVGYRGTVLRTDDGGMNWRSSRQGPTSILQGVSFTDSDNGVAVGHNGTALYSTNAGSDWILSASGTTQALRDVCFADASVAVAVGDEGTIIRTSNRGIDWESRSSGTTKRLYGVTFGDAECATAVGDGGIILRSTDVGETWTSQSSGVTSTLQDVDFTDRRTGAIVGEKGVILRTTDGGETWTPQSSGTIYRLNGVSFSDADHGMAVGYKATILRTTNGGETWDSLYGGTPKDLRELLDVECIDAMHGTIVGRGVIPGIEQGRESVIIRTTDGGAGWSFDTYSSPAPLPLNAIDLIDAYTGTAVGEDGTIIRRFHDPSTGVESDRPRENTRPVTSRLEQNYPNPVRTTTSIPFVLDGPGHATMVIYNILGQCVARLVDAQLPAGRHTVNFNPVGLPPGLYICTLRSGGASEAKAMLVMPAD